MKKIAIDGPAASGKSTVAQLIAEKLAFTYIDTGAMYRAITYQVLQNNIEPTDEEKVYLIAQNSKLDFCNNSLFLNEIDITNYLRQENIEKHVSIIARNPLVRNQLVTIQRAMGCKKAVIMEGRDIGSCVFPDADLKIYLTATKMIRAKRRYWQLLSQNKKVNLETIKQQINYRDQIDSTRKAFPLTITADAHYLDSSHLKITEVVEKIIYYANDCHL